MTLQVPNVGRPVDDLSPWQATTFMPKLKDFEAHAGYCIFIQYSGQTTSLRIDRTLFLTRGAPPYANSYIDLEKKKPDLLRIHWIDGLTIQPRGCR